MTARRGLKVGLLGGSFNPAHRGHRHISAEALKRLGLAQVWWLVSPQNPLKSAEGMADFDSRFAEAERMAAHPRIKVSDIEQRIRTRYTIDTLRLLKRQYPQHRFVWLMGADNLIQIPAWRGWREIFADVPIAVFDRPGYTHRAVRGRAAQYFNDARIKNSHALLSCSAPAWCFLFTPRDHISATELRRKLKKLI